MPRCCPTSSTSFWGEEYPGSAFPVQSGIHRENFYTDPIRLVVPADGALTGSARSNGTPRRLSDLKDRPWALEPSGTRIHTWTVAQCHDAGFEPCVLAHTPDPLLNIQLVRCGHAVYFVPSLLGEAHFEGIVPLDLPDRPSRTLFTAVRTGRETHPALLAVRDALTRAAQAIERPPAVRTLEA
ncbi:DNA-binding transcriptional LysR family regulator [Prauserella sediminis]|uniref:DNA-binding transcriptional LysR family regulator n=2 Tax=Prauserella sediminis TaxID=577680 RepID=A0A839XZV3_9PSEU|nr:DNA-binding transcriptional LysR family regulator [Prauserella sediminis]